MRPILMILTILMAMFVVACTNCKKPGDLRCYKNKVQVCGGDKRWKESRNCSKIKNTKCGEYKGVTTCVYQKPAATTDATNVGEVPNG